MWSLERAGFLFCAASEQFLDCRLLVARFDIHPTFVWLARSSDCFTRWVVILSWVSIGSWIGWMHQFHGRMKTFEEAFSLPVLLDGIRETREVLHVPVCRFVHGVASMSAMLIIHVTSFDKNRQASIVLFADETSLKCVSLSEPIPLSISDKSDENTCRSIWPTPWHVSSRGAGCRSVVVGVLQIFCCRSKIRRPRKWFHLGRRGHRPISTDNILPYLLERKWTHRP